MAPGGQKNLPPGGAGGIASTSGFQPFLVAMKEKYKNCEGAGDAVGAGLLACSEVEVVGDEGLVEYIKVHCKCGEVTVIECDYSDR
jgi:hypothetical protein